METGGASRWWLHQSLDALQRSLAALKCPILFRRGQAAGVIRDLAAETNAHAVYWNRCYEPYAIRRDTDLKAALKSDNVAVESFNAALLFEPWQVKTKSGTAPKVYSPYWRALRLLGDPEPESPAPLAISHPVTKPAGDTLADWHLLPQQPDWASGFTRYWSPGEQGARDRLEAFLDTGLDTYKKGRNFPSKPFVSRLSPHLHMGEISPRQIWHQTVAHCLMAGRDPFSGSAEHFLKELVWREFSYSQLYYNPDLPDACLRPNTSIFREQG